MDLQAIEAALENPDFQYRLQAISALRNYEPEVALPLLLRQVHDPEFLVRTFVAMGLGKQQTAESFAALMEIMKSDNTPSVRAEAANSLSLFGKVSASHLVLTFHQDDHWLVRRSIIAALADLKCFHELWEVCQQAIDSEDEDLSVQESSVDALGVLAGTIEQKKALNKLLELAKVAPAHIRIRVAYALRHFQESSAQEALNQLRDDPDHKVVGAALEGLLSE